MKKPLKITIIIIAVLLIVFTGITLFVKSYLTDARVRTFITSAAEKSLDRKVMLGDIKVSLFQGIVVKDFEIREKDSALPFIRTKDFVLKYQLLPLLSKKLVIDELRIVDPEIHLKKKPDGSFNFSDITKAGEPPERKDREKGPSALPVNLNMKSISIRNAKLDYTDPSGKLKQADLMMNADLGITSLSPKVLKSEGRIDVTVVTASLKDGKQPLKDLKTDITYKVSVDMGLKKITIDSLEAGVMKIPVNVQGTVTYAAEPALALDMKIKDLDLSRIREISSKFLPEGTNPGGNISLQLAVSKKPVKESAMSFDGMVTMNKVSFDLKGMQPVLDGRIKLSPEVITFEGLRLLAGQDSADISGTVRNYQEYPDLNIGIKGRSLDLDQLIVLAPSSNKPEEGARTGTAQTEPGPMNLKMRVNVVLDIDKTRYKGVAITNFRSSYALKDNIVKIMNLSGNTLSGNFALKAVVDLTKRGTSYSMNSDMNGVKIEDIINAFAPKAKGKLSGTLYGKAEISGAGTLPEHLKSNLKGKGNFSIKDGVMKNAEMSTGLLAILGLQELNEIPMQKAEGSFTISNGIVDLKSLIMSKDLILDETGTVGLNERLDVGILVKVSDRLAPKLVRQSAITGFLSEEKGWTSIPLRLGGTIAKPSYAIDTRAVGKKATETIKKKIGEELFKSLQKDKEQPAGTEKKKETTPQNLIKDLFGK